MRFNTTIGLGIIVCAGSLASASGVGDINGLTDSPRIFNDYSGSNLSFMSTYNPAGSSVQLTENDYGTGGFANRHAAWFDNGAGSRVDFDYGDGFDFQMTMQINDASDVANVEAGFQLDLFGFGLFGALTATGEIAAFGSVLPFYSFGNGLYNVGDELSLRMVHTPGAGEGSGGAPSTMEYLYNNMTTGSGWVSSGLINFDNLEGGIPSSFDLFAGVGAQINQPGLNGSVDISYRDITTSVPSPASLGLLSLGGLCMSRRRR